MYSFQILPAYSEPALINLGLASGLLGFALEIDGDVLPAAATGQSTFTFRFRPHPSISQVFKHQKGQVEIDALFVAKRNGREELFVIEAKAGNVKSVSKHKLAYPILSLADEIPAGMTIVPVYVHARQEQGEFHYHVVECTFDISQQPACIADLTPVRHVHLVLPFQRIRQR